MSRFKAEKLGVTGEKVFSIISKGKIFRADRKKILVVTKIYIFLLFYFTLNFVTDNAKPKCLDCLNSNI